MQPQRAVAETRERIESIMPQLLCQLPRARNTDRADVGRLVVLGVLAGSLAQGRRGAFGIEHVIHHLERKPDQLGELVELAELLFTEPVAAARAEQRRSADYGPGL